jgi:hypothetical protein
LEDPLCRENSGRVVRGGSGEARPAGKSGTGGQVGTNGHPFENTKIKAGVADGRIEFERMGDE